uniref:Uncharacterized protein n=1 Tax=Rhizophora mucronata TaxID=61149 RepID=A0A2P2P8V9_RHIMU
MPFMHVGALCGSPTVIELSDLSYNGVSHGVNMKELNRGFR